MILKFLRGEPDYPKINYFNVPDDTAMHRQYVDEKGRETWVLVLNEDYWRDNRYSVFGKIINDAYVNTISLEPYTFIFISSIVSDNWKSMSDIDFHEKFRSFFASTYIYETVYLEREMYNVMNNLTELLDANSFVELKNRYTVTGTAQKISGLDRGRFIVHSIHEYDQFGNGGKLTLISEKLRPDEILHGSYKSDIYVSHDPTEYDNLLNKCFYEFKFNENI